MDLQKLVPLEKTCEKLKGLRLNQDTAFNWYNIGANSFVQFATYHIKMQGRNRGFLCKAPTASELGGVLPIFIKVDGNRYNYSQDFTGGMKWSMGFCDSKYNNCCNFQHENEAEARAQLIIWLIENKHLEFNNN